ncbi:MAG: tyrosine-type recombinase/integrase [Candidatus Binatia bacterium]
MAVKIKQHKGAWWLFIDHKGKRKAKRVGSKSAAETAAKKIEAKIALGQFEIKDEQQKRPFNAYYKHWLETYVKVHCKERTLWLYEAAFRIYLFPAFGSQDISEISRDAVKKLAYDMLAQGRTRSTVNGVLAPLHGMFTQAIEDGHADRNPCFKILRKSRKEAGEQEQRISFLTKEEVGLLLRTSQEHFPAVYPFLSLLIRTGIRMGEAIGLQWGDLDFQGRFISIQRTLSHGKLTTPKSGKSRRVDMSLQLTETLKASLVERKQETLQHGWREVPEWVFISTERNPIDQANFHNRVWRKLLAKAGLRYIRVHDLRHTFASLLIQNGESLAYVKEQMGHHSIKITVDTYGHLVPGGNKAAVDRLDNLETATIRNPDATDGENAVSKVGSSG